MPNPERRSLTDLEGRPAKSLRFRSQRRFRLPCSLIALAIIGILFWMIPPARTDVNISAALTEDATRFPLPPTPTSPPRPTPVHGGRIVFTCSRGDFNQLCLVNVDGTGYQQLTNQYAHDYYPAFAPGGGVVVFASNRNSSFDLYLLMLDEDKLYQLTSRIGNAFSPDFSPDGEQIVFANQPAEGPASLWTVGRNGENPRLLYTGTDTIVAAAWSPDGQTIAFAMSTGQEGAYGIFLLDLQNIEQQPINITPNLVGVGGSLDWSPDGKYLLFYAGPPGNKDVYRLEAATGNVRQMTTGGNNAAASYSPDGQWIVFNSLRNNGQADLFIMNADGYHQRQLTEDPEPEWQPVWEP